MTEAEFLKDVDDWSTHRPLLWLALDATAGSPHPVLELGMGDGSTPYLHACCEAEGRHLISVDNDAEWCDKFSRLASKTHEIRCAGRNWSRFAPTTDDRFSVVLADHAPMERRERDVGDLAAKAGILVIHDTEGHAFDGIWKHFPYKAELVTAGACAAAVSQTIDVTKWKGLSVGGFSIS